MVFHLFTERTNQRHSVPRKRWQLARRSTNAQTLFSSRSHLKSPLFQFRRTQTLSALFIAAATSFAMWRSVSPPACSSPSQMRRSQILPRQKFATRSGEQHQSSFVLAARIPVILTSFFAYYTGVLVLKVSLWITTASTWDTSWITALSSH